MEKTQKHESLFNMMYQISDPGTKVEIVSGEGDGPGTIEVFKGTRTARAIRKRINKEKCGGDRWCFLLVNGIRID
jgi:hypothetical protein